MPSATTLGVFSVTALALLVVPGPAVLYVVTRSIDQGRRAGVASVFGIGVGSLVHVIAAAAGLSVLLASSVTAFTAVKYLGAAYLLALGVRKLLERDQRCVDGEDFERVVPPLRRVFAQGVVVQVLNPKAAFFLLAFLPQFIDPAAGPVALQISVLGAVFVLLSLLSDGTYAVLAGVLGSWLRRSIPARRFLRYVSAGVYVSLGTAAAVSGGRSTTS
jgi:threonine/homoserine/homoserine lactone efflux protein